MGCGVWGGVGLGGVSMGGSNSRRRLMSAGNNHTLLTWDDVLAIPIHLGEWRREGLRFNQVASGESEESEGYQEAEHRRGEQRVKKRRREGEDRATATQHDTKRIPSK